MNRLRETVLVALCALLTSPVLRADDAEADDAKRQLYTGQVVLVREALAKRGVKTFDEMEGQVALETFDGRLFPIVSDWRGRAFYQDERLRNRKVELVCYQREGVPYLQVLVVFTFNEEGRRQYTDYWCDICSIPMYEIKPCDCCQQPIRLRFQPRGLPDYLEGPARTPIGLAEKSGSRNAKPETNPKSEARNTEAADD